MAINTTTNPISNGLLPDAPAPSSLSYTLRTNCAECTITMYMRLVCHDDMQVLVVDGEAPIDVLRATRDDIITEFGELSGNAQSSAISETMAEIYKLRALITCLGLCMQLIEQRSDMGQVIDFLRDNTTLRPELPQNDAQWAKLAKQVKGTMSASNVLLRKALKRYEEAAKRGDSQKFTESDFRDQIAAISRHMGYKITTDTTMAEYASYIKDFNRSIEQLKHSKHNVIANQ